MKRSAPRARPRSVTITFTLREVEALREATLSSDQYGEPEDYDPAMIAALHRARRKLVGAVVSSQRVSVSESPVQPARGGQKGAGS